MAPAIFLAGVFLRDPPFPRFYAERIMPVEGFAGAHAYVTDGIIAFDYHGYSRRERLLTHHAKGWSQRYPGWQCDIEVVDFDLLDTHELNRRKMRGLRSVSSRRHSTRSGFSGSCQT
jgi:hypothetical protein